MEVYRLLKPVNGYLRGMVGTYDDILSDGRISIIMEYKCGIKQCLFLDQELVEEVDCARVDSDTGLPIFEGWYFESLGIYHGNEDRALELCQHYGYRALDEAYEDDFCYWTQWGAYYPNEVLGKITNYEIVEA